MYYDHFSLSDDYHENGQFNRHQEDFSDTVRSTMAPGIPSKCDRCGEVYPSKQALLAHKAEMHPNEKGKNSAVKKVKGAEGLNSPKTPAAGSPKVMNQWMSGKARSTEIAKAIANSRQDDMNGAEAARKDTPAPVSVSLTNSMDDSINLLHDSRNDAASPYLATMRVFPSTMKATPLGDNSGTWHLVQPRQVVPEPEKSKRGRERYEDEASGEAGVKKPDDKVTPESKKAPRSLDNELAEFQAETLEAMDVEFSSVELDTEEWNRVTVQVQPQQVAGPTPTPTPSSDPSQDSLPVSQPESQPSQGGYLRASQLLSDTMKGWMESGDFERIPDEQQSPGLAPNQYDSLDLQESQYEKIELGQAKIRELQEKLEVSESTRQDHWESMMQLETRISDLELENRRLRQGKDQAEDAVASLTRDLTEKDSQVQKIKDRAIQMANNAGKKINILEAEVSKKESEVIGLKTEVGKTKESLDNLRKTHNDRVVKSEQEKRAEVERLKAINIQAVNDLKRMKVTSAVVTELKASLVKAEGEKELEKLKAEKAQDMVTKLEDLLKEAQVEKANYEKRNTDLLNSNRVLARSQPCNRENCDHGCGKDHHCGTVSRRNRSRNRRRSSNSDAPTVANLADAAGSSVNSMQQVVDGVRTNHQQQARLPPRGPRTQSLNRHPKDWKVGLCHDFFNLKMCARGEDCRNAHQLIGANTMAAMAKEQLARPRTGSLGTAPSQQPVVPSAKGFKPIPNPVFHPDHHLAKQLPQFTQRVQQNQQIHQRKASGNGQGQRSGAATVQTPQPQQIQPQQNQHLAQPQVSQGASAQGPFQQAQVQQPRTYSEAVSDRAARQTVRDSMQQQASTGAQISALEEDPWFAQMEDAYGMRMSALLDTNSQSENAPQNNQSASQGRDKQ